MALPYLGKLPVPYKTVKSFNDSTRNWDWLATHFRNYTHLSTIFVNVKDYGAKGDGATDDTAAINLAISDSSEGSVIYFPPGEYLISAPIVLKRGMILHGTQLGIWKIGDDEQTCFLSLSSTFAGSSAILIEDKTLKGTALDTSFIGIRHLGVDGHQYGAFHAIHTRGHVRNLHLYDIDIRRPGGDCIKVEDVSGRRAQEYYFSRVFTHGANGHGIWTDDLVDVHFVDCHSFDNGNHGFRFGSLSNATLVGCSSEWNRNGASGYHFVNGTNYAPGNVELAACATDRNDGHGVYIATRGAQNNKPIILSGCRQRRDGRNGAVGGGGYAGICVEGGVGNLAQPVHIFPAAQNTDNDDNGTGTHSPQYGLKASYALHVQVGGGQLWGRDAAWFDDGNNSTIHFAMGTRQITGDFNAPVSALKWAIQPGGGLVGNATDGALWIDIPEQTVTPGPPAANYARWFVRDTGAGRTEIRARFPTGGTVGIAQEPAAPSVASAANITLSPHMLTVVTGTTTITSITADYAGRLAVIRFSGALTLTDGSNLILNGNFVTTADDTITLVSDGTNWYEVSRSAN